MKKILFLLLLTVSSYGQTLQSPTYNNTTTNTLKVKTNTEASTSTKLSTQEADGAINYIQPINVPIPFAPTNYTISDNKIGSHLSGINTRLGQISSTTTDAVINKSAITGVTSTDALNSLNTLKANSSSPTFTGTPTAPTATVNTTGNQIATLDFAANVRQPEASRLSIASTNIIGWGDSLTAGAGGGGTTYLSTLNFLTKFNVTNNGVGGETSTQIKDRFLANTADFDKTVIIWAGRNNYTDPITVKADIATMVANLTHTRYLVISVLNGNGEGIGTSNYNTIIQLNNDLKAIYGKKYLDLRAYLVSLHNSTAQDLLDYENDIPPTSLRSDGIHLNTQGYTNVGEFFNKNLGVLFEKEGYLQSKDFKYYFENYSPLHSISDESFTGVKTATNTGTTQVNGINLVNNGTTSTARSLSITNNGTGYGSYFNNVGSGYAIGGNNASSGRFLYFTNTSTGFGSYITNSSTGIGQYLNNTGSGQGIRADNAGSGYGFYSNNTGAGLGAYFLNSSTGIANVLNSATASTGDLLQFQKNGVVKSYVNNLGEIHAQTPTAGTNTTQVATTAFVQSATRPYKDGTYALISQTITNGVTENSPSEDAIFDALALKANDSDVIKTTGNDSFSGVKSFSNTSALPASISATNSSTALTAAISVVNSSATQYGLNMNNTAGSFGNINAIGGTTGNSINTSTTDGTALNSLATGTGNSIVSNVTGSGFNYVGQNNGTNTFTVGKTGVGNFSSSVTASSFIVSGGIGLGVLLDNGTTTPYLELLRTVGAQTKTGALSIVISDSANAITANQTTTGTGNNFVGSSNGVNTFTVNKLGSAYFAGNVGIGTSPGSIGVGFGSINTNGANGSGIIFGQTGQVNNLIYTDSNGFNIETLDKPIKFNALGERVRINTNGHILINTTTDNNIDTLQINGTTSGSPATLSNQYVTKSQLDAISLSGVKRYKALISQSGTSAPTVTVLENSLGSVVWTRTTTGQYTGTLTGVFTSNKVYGNFQYRTFSSPNIQTSAVQSSNVNTIDIFSLSNGSVADSILTGCILIEVYP